MSFPVNAFLAVVSVPFSAQGMVLCSKPRRFTTVSVLLAFRSLAMLAALAPSMLLTVWVRGKSSFSLLLFLWCAAQEVDKHIRCSSESVVFCAKAVHSPWMSRGSMSLSAAVVWRSCSCKFFVCLAG